eukprot:9684677-Alexandrium_andersonii.AAC.1
MPPGPSLLCITVLRPLRARAYAAWLGAVTPAAAAAAAAASGPCPARERPAPPGPLLRCLS